MSVSPHADVSSYLRANEGVAFSDLESVLLRAILKTYDIDQVNNLEIRDIINARSLDQKRAEKWIAENLLTPTIQHLLTFYELRVSPTSRKLDGAYYTPQSLVDEIVDLTLQHNTGSVCDPACGSGAFLLGATEKLKNNGAGTIPEILSKYIWGVDIDQSNVIFTKRVLSLYAILNGSDSKEFSIGIYQGNSLIFDWKTTKRLGAGFDFIVGNPPYVRGRNLTPQLKKQIKSWASAAAGIADLYMPFFEIGLAWLNSKGRVGYITPNTYFSSVNGKGVRNMICERRVLDRIIDLNGFPAFEGLLTYTCITILDKRGTKNPLVGVANSADELKQVREIELSPIDYMELGQADWYIQPEHIASEMRMMESAGTPLSNYVPRFTTGIATLRNDLYIINAAPANGLLTFEKFGKQFSIEEGITVPIIKPNKIKTAAKLELNQERALYPYKIPHNNKGRPILIPEQELKEKYPLAYSYLLTFKSDLEKRSLDRGAAWYAYGRSQAIDGFGEKIIFPMMADKPAFLHVTDPHTLIYCGYALYPDSEEKTKILLKILNSSFFWNYISRTSKNYANGYKSMAKNYVKKFSIPDFTPKEKVLLYKLSGSELDNFLKRKYTQKFLSIDSFSTLTLI